MRHLKSIIEHAIDRVSDSVSEGTDLGDLHHHLFNEDYFIVGYYDASQWLKANNIGEFEAMNACIDYCNEHFGEVESGKYDNSETVVNMYAYIKGEELLQDLETVGNGYTEFGNVFSPEFKEAILEELEALL